MRVKYRNTNGGLTYCLAEQERRCWSDDGTLTIEEWVTQYLKLWAATAAAAATEPAPLDTTVTRSARLSHNPNQISGAARGSTYTNCGPAKLHMWWKNTGAALQLQMWHQSSPERASSAAEEVRGARWVFLHTGPCMSARGGAVVSNTLSWGNSAPWGPAVATHWEQSAADLNHGGENVEQLRHTRHIKTIQ